MNWDCLITTVLLCCSLSLEILVLCGFFLNIVTDALSGFLYIKHYGVGQMKEVCCMNSIITELTRLSVGNANQQVPFFLQCLGSVVSS